MSMSLRILPLGRSVFTVDLDEPPQWEEDEDGGWKDASFQCTIDPAQQDYLREATVILDGPLGPLYMGVARGYDGAAVYCRGWHGAVMEGKTRAGIYCDTELPSWRETTHTSRQPFIQVQQSGDGGITAMWQPTTAYAADAYNCVVYEFGETVANGVITFDFERPSTDWYYSIYTLTSTVSSSYKELGLVDDVHTQAQTGNLTDTGISWSFTNAWGLIFRFHKHTALTVSNTTRYTYLLTNVKVYATACGTTVTPHAIVDDCLDQLESWQLGGRDVAADATSLVPFVQDGTERDRINALLGLVDGSFIWEARGTSTAPWAVYRARPSSPIYHYIEDGSTVTCDLSKGDSEAMASAQRVYYQDQAGTNRYVDVYDTNAAHYLVQIGRYNGGTYGPKWAEPMRLNLATSTTATTAGTQNLAYLSADQYTGRIELEGCDPYPGYIQPGQLMRIQTFDFGVIDVRVRSVSKRGFTSATVTVDITASPMDTIIRAVERANRTQAIKTARAIPLIVRKKKKKKRKH